MNSSSSQTSITFQLKDGQSRLSAWTQSVEKFPTIGESIELEKDVRNSHPDYAPTARVVQVDYDANSGETTVTLEASPAENVPVRPVVFLNLNYIPESLREEAEERARKAFELPLVEWVNSFEAKPITQVHQASDEELAGLETLQNELRELVEITLEDLAFVKE
ncbi:MAG: hypothetical protein QM627_04750 [Luteolibacter sp.]